MKVLSDTTEGVRIEKVSKSFGAHGVIQAVDVAIDPGEFVVIVGPSGCGKSTLLRMIAGLETVSEGRILIGGHDVTHIEPSRRDVAMVFQSYALYPYLDVSGNIGFGLSVARRPKAEIRARVGEVAEMLRLTELLHRRPADLSGGQRQRVAIGRALVRKPAVFLFDEPLSNLDAELRVELRRELARLHQQIGATMIYVTHDQVEAMTLADRIVVMRGGVVQQVGRPLDLYRAPANTFVAGFIGSPRMNFLPMVVRGNDGHVHHITRTAPGADDLRIVLDRTLPAGTVLTAGIRPESLGSDAVAGGLQLSAVSTMVEAMGNLTYEYAEGEGDLRLTIEHRGAIEARPGQRLDLWCASDHIHLFDADGARIGTRQD